ncbi:bifunctional diaminohydroxyphosphoribosylaminopyrimidine deaminase/5-amino-6-(5-phosphoribosylamino)uracil reductase RibD [Frigidibacter sp. RF13]|uniref:bifunctional diaminohydroxyphosphoribosylaminopyrimidine deaminase/5-amino-6-(5-phosphoribosylamino)uracil reductase RibD n=1 Tax=Frigidibacter sp. RF13 TaxID=2997340 RepID=UPI002270E4F6|nr:bifunctional diaminohydroxyphosphoribosylaminopyrimidine deaminase/5-amino-6-(5-phosphoribosylamino)uracil reductase RibD [Frigidibacter sp. RF13]MCY1126045.1 bifunctional diaminohydroxyphosphoribosylaminopyrimidine deaminase/5-amino-6-(5-phosphoribosylamino)uracil reductase RibD [Frigidibacter sp. RF13]
MNGADDRAFMAQAIALGARGLGRVWPNPAVGCVIVKAGRIVGRGWTADGGRPHAEPQALAQAGALARGATAYVSLEPCAHHGKTPPCAEALIAAGVARVVTALQDPDPRVAGGGHALLSDAGIAVDTGLMEDEARSVQKGFLCRIGLGRPMLTLKLATSLDGRIATSSGESRWITGPEARRRTHLMRARHDAILIGAGTARADDPVLTVRGIGASRQPVRIVAARRLDLPRDGQLARSAAEVPLWLLHGPDAPHVARDQWTALGARLIEVPQSEGGLDMTAAFQALGALGLTRVFCEGGGALAAALIGAGLADELAMFTAGLALGGDARPGVGALGLTALADAGRYRLEELCPVGGDVLSRWSRV